MPYKSEGMRIPKEYDRRVKLSDEQKEEIRAKYDTGMYSQRGLAKDYNVSRRLISFILDENKAKKCSEQLAIRRADGRYKQTKEKRAAVMRNHRQYKQELYLNGKLIAD